MQRDACTYRLRIATDVWDGMEGFHNVAECEWIHSKTITENNNCDSPNLVEGTKLRFDQKIARSSEMSIAPSTEFSPFAITVFDRVAAIRHEFYVAFGRVISDAAISGGLGNVRVRWSLTEFV